jgi:hypothetical protein
MCVAYIQRRHMADIRRNFRLRKQFDVTWSVPSQKIEGEGLISNISVSGMLFVTDKLFEPQHGLVMSFSIAQVPSFPPKGKLAWFRKVGRGEAQYQCGVQFLNEAVPNQLWIKWMEENIAKLGDIVDSRILDRFLSEGQQE